MPAIYVGLYNHLSTASFLPSLTRFVLSFLILLVPSFLMGGTLPIISRFFIQRFESLGTGVGSLHGVNTLGGATGAFCAAFLFLTWLGVRETIYVAAAVNKLYARDLSTLGRSIGNIRPANAVDRVAGAFIAGLVLIPSIEIGKSIMATALVNIGLGAIIALATVPTGYTVSCVSIAAVLILGGPLVTTILIPSADLQRMQPGEELLYYKEDSSASVAVVGRFNVKTLKVNGHEDVPTTYNALWTSHMLGHLPLMLRRNPQQMLVVSFGAGVASGAVAEHAIRQMDIVESHHETLGASDSFLEENQSVLSDPRVNLIVDDGRNHLLRTTKRCDVITSDATHPLGGDSWVLYTKEFYELCRNRLAPDGLMVQWLPIHMLAPADYRSVAQTFQSVFADTSLWYTNDYTLMLGATNGLTIDFTLLNKKFHNRKVREDLEEFNLGTPLAFLSTFVMDRESLVRHTQGTGINTDNHPFIEPPRRRTDIVAAPQNLIDLEESVESVFPLLANMGDAADTIKADTEKYRESQKRVIRGNFFKSVGARTLESREYQMALNVNPADNNARHLLQSVSIFADR